MHFILAQRLEYVNHETLIYCVVLSRRIQAGAQLTDAFTKLKTQARLAISDLKDVEETIWSPSYGMKGVVDATVGCRITQGSSLVHEDQQWILPLEIKTGRAISMSEHRAQTILYTLLLGERYGE